MKASDLLKLYENSKSSKSVEGELKKPTVAKLNTPDNHIGNKKSKEVKAKNLGERRRRVGKITEQHIDLEHEYPDYNSRIVELQRLIDEAGNNPRNLSNWDQRLYKELMAWYDSNNSRGSNGSDERYVGESRWEDITFVQGYEADKMLDVIIAEGAEGAERVLRHLKKRHKLGEHRTSSRMGAGIKDSAYSNGGYLMTWNSTVGYIGLEYNKNSQITEGFFKFELDDEEDEDEIMADKDPANWDGNNDKAGWHGNFDPPSSKDVQESYYYGYDGDEDPLGYTVTRSNISGEYEVLGLSTDEAQMTRNTYGDFDNIRDAEMYVEKMKDRDDDDEINARTQIQRQANDRHIKRNAMRNMHEGADEGLKKPTVVKVKNPSGKVRSSIPKNNPVKQKQIKKKEGRSMGHNTVSVSTMKKRERDLKIKEARDIKELEKFLGKRLNIRIK